jgi:hypothetical protein
LDVVHGQMKVDRTTIELSCGSIVDRAAASVAIIRAREHGSA